MICVLFANINRALCVLVNFWLRCRVWIAPSVDETENELSFCDEFLLPKPPFGRKVEVELEVDLDE